VDLILLHVCHTTMIPRHLLCSLHRHPVSETRAQMLHSFHHNLSPASLHPHMAPWIAAVAALEPGGLSTDSSFGMGSPRNDIMHHTWGNLIFISICISDIDPYPRQSARSETLLHLSTKSSEDALTKHLPQMIRLLRTWT
jgi:hypothetical protein